MASKTSKNNREQVAKKNAMDKILSSSARHQAQQRAEYVTENGLDREDAGKNRRQLNETVGRTETKNLWEGRKHGVRDYVAERAAQRTKAKKNAEYQMKYAEYQNTDDRMDDLRRGQRAIDRKAAAKKSESSRDRVKKVFEGAEGRKALEQALAAQKKKQKK